MQEILVGSVREFPEEESRVLAIGELEVGIFRHRGGFVAYENWCPHRGGPVCQGKIFNRVEEIIDEEQKSRGLRFAAERRVVCPWHGYEFDLDTGCHPGNPKVRLRPVRISVRDDCLFLILPENQSKSSATAD